MKKEFIYISVLLVLAIAGFLYKSMFMSSKIDSTRGISEELAELRAKYDRDSLVQENLQVMKNLFEQNKRDSRTYSENVVDLLNVVENMLREAGVKYQANDLRQDPDELLNRPSGTSSFFINLNFSTDYEKIKKLLDLIEMSSYIINVQELSISRIRQSPDKNTLDLLESRGLQYDEFNVKLSLNVSMRLEFVKFL